MITLRDWVVFFVLLILLTACRMAIAEQAVDIRFSRDAATGHEVLKARTEYSQHGKAMRKILMTFHEYAELHPWIMEATPVHPPLDGRAQILIRFRFPWPVGHRWSRIAITTNTDTAVTWHQVDGDLKANRGRLGFIADGEAIGIDYSAVISVGLPDAWTRAFKKRFVSEFIDAAWSRASATADTRLRLAGDVSK